MAFAKERDRFSHLIDRMIALDALDEVLISARILMLIFQCTQLTCDNIRSKPCFATPVDRCVVVV